MIKDQSEPGGQRRKNKQKDPWGSQEPAELTIHREGSCISEKPKHLIRGHTHRVTELVFEHHCCVALSIGGQ